MAIIELVAGLFLIVAHNAWSPLPAAVISVIGWMAVLEGAAYLLLPDAWVARMVGAFSTPAWYAAGGLLSMAVGIYLAGFGFGWIG